jgi:hypothetical protein
MDIEELFTDEKSENDGVWVDAGDYDVSLRGIELKVARMLNPAFTRMFDELRREAGPTYDKDERVKTTVMIKCMAAHILKGWKNLTLKGKAVAYTTAKAEDYLAKSSDLRNVVTRIASDRQRYKAVREKADLKN